MSFWNVPAKLDKVKNLRAGDYFGHPRIRLSPGLILVATLAIIVPLLSISCKPETPSAPTKPPPAYTLDITYPSQEWLVTVTKGSSVTLPVRIRSLVDESINIRLALTAPGEVPEFIEYEVPHDYLTLNPGDNVSTQVVIKVFDTAPVGNYLIGITGGRPVKERSGEAMMFTLAVINK